MLLYSYSAPGAKSGGRLNASPSTSSAVHTFSGSSSRLFASSGALVKLKKPDRIFRSSVERDLVPVGNAFDVFRDRIVEAQLAFLDHLHDRGGRHRLGVRRGAEMGVRPRRVRGADLVRAVAEGDVALRRPEQDHGAGEHELLRQPLDAGLKRGRIDRLQPRRGRAHGAARCVHRNNHGAKLFSLSLSHSLARDELCRKNCRLLSVPGI